MNSWRRARILAIGPLEIYHDTLCHGYPAIAESTRTSTKGRDDLSPRVERSEAEVVTSLPRIRNETQNIFISREKYVENVFSTRIWWKGISTFESR